jgi:glycosyltransferase involved in cell wall biosynthesis
MKATDPELITGTILALALNEEIGIRKILGNWSIPRGWKLLVVDGGSTDNTTKVCTELGIDFIVQSRSGIRHAYSEAWKYDLGKYVITISPDGNCDLSKVSLIIEQLEKGYDLVIGSRYLNGAKSEDDDLITGFGNRVFNYTFRKFFGGELTDCMVIYRGFNKKLPEQLGLLEEKPYFRIEKFLKTGISWEPLMSIRAVVSSVAVTEISAGEPARIAGERKLQIFRWGSAYMIQFFIEYLRKFR